MAHHLAPPVRKQASEVSFVCVSKTHTKKLVDRGVRTGSSLGTPLTSTGGLHFLLSEREKMPIGSPLGTLLGLKASAWLSQGKAPPKNKKDEGAKWLATWHPSRANKKNCAHHLAPPFWHRPPDWCFLFRARTQRNSGFKGVKRLMTVRFGREPPAI